VVVQAAMPYFVTVKWHIDAIPTALLLMLR